MIKGFKKGVWEVLDLKISCKEVGKIANLMGYL